MTVLLVGVREQVFKIYCAATMQNQNLKIHYFKQIHDQFFVTYADEANCNLNFFVNDFTYDLLKCTVDFLKHTHVLI